MRTRSTSRNTSRTVRRPRLSILPYGPSDSVNALKTALAESLDQRVAALKIDGSSIYRGRTTDTIINWGNSRFSQANVLGQANVLNRPAAIRQASMKTEAFREMDSDGVPTVQFTTSRDTAQAWVDGGDLVYARTVLQGHSGEGIVMIHNNPSSIQGVGGAFEVQSSLPQAPLYTKGITAQRREFRIHVMKGVVTYVQQKKRADGYRENENYSNVVRNYHTGWIYASSDIRPNDAALDAAIRSVNALGLDFGAVDVITRRDDAWVLEVNTAPGLQGTNLETYTNNFVRIFQGLEPVEWSPNTSAVSEQEYLENDDRTLDELSEEFSEPVPPPVEPVSTVQLEAMSILAEANNTPETRNRRDTQRRVAGQTVTRRHNAFYEATVNGERMIVQYNEEAAGFYMPGWEIPMTDGEDGLVVGVEI